MYFTLLITFAVACRLKLKRTRAVASVADDPGRAAGPLAGGAVLIKVRVSKYTITGRPLLDDKALVILGDTRESVQESLPLLLYNK